jgi:response regulator RpfG family c-di-GMP phosphodiesterase
MRSAQVRSVVFIIDDDEGELILLKRNIKEFAEIVTATNDDEARTVFEQERHRIKIIAIDGFANEAKTETFVPLLDELRPQFKGVIIATSGHAGLRDRMVDRHGCDLYADKEKLPEVIRKILGLQEI